MEVHVRGKLPPIVKLLGGLLLCKHLLLLLVLHIQLLLHEGLVHVPHKTRLYDLLLLHVHLWLGSELGLHRP